MAKRKVETIKVMDSIAATKAQMPKYNPYACGTGTWKSAKYPSRANQKADLRKEVT